MTTHEGLQIHLLARVGDSEVLNEIATIEQVLEVEPITDDNRTDADSATATARIQVDMAAALRACADEIDEMQGVAREPQLETRLALIAELLGSLDLDSSKSTAPGTAWGSILREALALAQEGAVTKPVPGASEERAELIERMRVAYTEAWEAEDARQAQARRDGTWVATSKPHVRSRAGITAALEALETGR